MNTPRLSNESILNGTGKSWDEWFALLESVGAREWPHKQIAEWLWDEKHCPRPWWGQAVVIGYEQAIGRRESGQRCSGDWNAGVSKTVAGDMDDALAIWIATVSPHIVDQSINGIELNGDARISTTEKWRYWRASLDDGTAVSVNISSKPNGKASIAVDHTKIGSKEEADAWKLFWKEVLASA